MKQIGIVSIINEQLYKYSIQVTKYIKESISLKIVDLVINHFKEELTFLYFLMLFWWTHDSEVKS